MNARVNLLPHREERRKRSRQHFMTVSFGTAVVGALLAGMVYQFYARQIERQIDRNTFLTNEIKKLDKDIADINELRNQIQALLARKQIIETLQADRAQTVHLLEQMVRQMPEGVYLKSMKQTGARIDLAGYAQSNARVSTLMRNIESSPWLASPGLVEVKATTVAKRRIAQFNLNFQVKRVQPKSPDKDAGKPAAKKG